MSIFKKLLFSTKPRRIESESKEISRLASSQNYRFISFASPGHFYSPIPDLDEVLAKKDVLFDRSRGDIPSIKLNTRMQLDLVDRFSAYYNALPFTEYASDNMRFYLDNIYFSYGDSIILYCLMRHFRPKKIIEIGSGFSSACMLDVDDKFFGRAIDFLFVEPNPERLQSLFRPEDKQTRRVVNEPVQNVPLQIFRELSANDLLFVDSSHVVKIGNDVSHIIFNILPVLRQGVIIHFHDILWPFEYPYNWLFAGRAWNEAYFIRAFLQFNNSVEILFFNSFIEEIHSELLQEKMPLVLKKPSYVLTPGNSSLWLRKTSSNIT